MYKEVQKELIDMSNKYDDINDNYDPIKYVIRCTLSDTYDRNLLIPCFYTVKRDINQQNHIRNKF